MDKGIKTEYKMLKLQNHKDSRHPKLKIRFPAGVLKFASLKAQRTFHLSQCKQAKTPAPSENFQDFHSKN